MGFLLYYRPGCFGPPVVFFRLRASASVSPGSSGSLMRGRIPPDLWPCFEPVPFQKLPNGAAISSSICQKYPALCICMQSCKTSRCASLRARLLRHGAASRAKTTMDLKKVLVAAVDIGLSGAPCIASKVARLGRRPALSSARISPHARRPGVSQDGDDLVPSPMPTAGQTQVCVHLFCICCDHDSSRSRPWGHLFCSLTMSRCRFSGVGVSVDMQ
ncbi:hypothetical protein IWX90DRAFT_74217 [Phyllosticta citrichinensis]|uniref:Uncharacterized protein n=1 Tax=Phyllosticta citrichinensis TaxID=1130410 RepID=A0ABR1XGI7_9PEZI